MAAEGSGPAAQGSQPPCLVSAPPSPAPRTPLTTLPCSSHSHPHISPSLQQQPMQQPKQRRPTPHLQHPPPRFRMGDEDLTAVFDTILTQFGADLGSVIAVEPVVVTAMPTTSSAGSARSKAVPAEEGPVVVVLEDADNGAPAELPQFAIFGPQRGSEHGETREITDPANKPPTIPREHAADVIVAPLQDAARTQARPPPSPPTPPCPGCHAPFVPGEPLPGACERTARNPPCSTTAPAGAAQRARQLGSAGREVVGHRGRRGALLPAGRPGVHHGLVRGLVPGGAGCSWRRALGVPSTRRRGKRPVLLGPGPGRSARRRVIGPADRAPSRPCRSGASTGEGARSPPRANNPPARLDAAGRARSGASGAAPTPTRPMRRGRPTPCSPARTRPPTSGWRLCAQSRARSRSCRGRRPGR